MTTPDPVEVLPTPDAEKEERKRRRLLLLLLSILLLLCIVGCLFLRYLLKPQAITDIVPLPPAVAVAPPAYVKMITGVDGPMGVAVSPNDQRLYVTACQSI
jgi:hypothetical protein